MTIQTFRSSSFLIVAPGNVTGWAFGSNNFAAAFRALPKRVWVSVASGGPVSGRKCGILW